MSLVTPERALDLVTRAAEGDQAAWDQLVDNLNGLLWTVARSAGLDPSDAADVVQTTWLRLAENLARIKDPERVSAWLVTTTRRESFRVLRSTKRHVPVDQLPTETVESGDEADTSLLQQESHAELWGAFSTLPALCRALLRVLMADPAPSYAEVSAALDMPVGSIGPRRARCLERLRSLYEVQAESRGCPL